MNRGRAAVKQMKSPTEVESRTTVPMWMWCIEAHGSSSSSSAEERACVHPPAIKKEGQVRAVEQCDPKKAIFSTPVFVSVKIRGDRVIVEDESRRSPIRVNPKLVSKQEKIKTKRGLDT